MDGWTDRWMNGCVYRQMDGWTDVGLDRWMDGGVEKLYFITVVLFKNLKLLLFTKAVQLGKKR